MPASIILYLKYKKRFQEINLLTLFFCEQYLLRSIYQYKALLRIKDIHCTKRYIHQKFRMPTKYSCPLGLPLSPYCLP